MNRIPQSLAMARNLSRLALGTALALIASSATAAETLFDSKPLTPAGEYNKGIEGPAVNAAGDLFVVNIHIPHADPKLRGGIGQVKKGATQSRFFARLDPGGAGNGIRFDLQGRMYVADFQLHAIAVFEPGSTTPQRYFPAAPDPHDAAKPAFTQPNDIAIARDGTLYASDPDFGKGTGRIWRITRGADGKGIGIVMSSARPQGITNGIDLSPDNKTLYVSESSFNGPPKRPASLWAYRIEGAALADPVALKTFSEGGDVDGLKVDTDGRIFVARPEARQVFILVPPGSAGEARDPVKTTGKSPNNLTFGGADGRDVYVTQNESDAKRFIEHFRTDRPGREPCLQPGVPDCRPVGP